MDVHRVATTAFGDKRPPIDPVGVAEEEPLRGTSGQKYRVRRRTSPSQGTASLCGEPDPAAAFLVGTQARAQRRAMQHAATKVEDLGFGS